MSCEPGNDGDDNDDNDNDDDGGSDSGVGVTNDTMNASDMYK